MAVVDRGSSRRCSKLDALLAHEEEIRCFLMDTNMLEFVGILFKNRVLSRESKDKFNSLDHAHLDTDVTVRYVLHEAFEKVKMDARVFERLVEVLNKLGGEMRSLCLAIKKWLKESTKDDTSDHSTKDVVLTKKDVWGIVNLIADESHHWEEIGIALGLHASERAECGRGNSNIVKLTNVITAWVSRSCMSTDPATLSKLKEALAGNIVTLKNLAVSLSRYEFQRESEGELGVLLSVIGIPEIVFQSDDTSVDDGKATILMIQVDSKEFVSYQWSNETQLLQDGDCFEGVNTSMLLIRRADQCTEGKYSCCVSREGQEVRSEEINVEVLYPHEKQRLMGKYCKDKIDVPQDTWPPVVVSTFIDLVLIKRSRMMKGNYYTVQGDIDDILEGTETIKYDEFLKFYEEGALILVEGRPGCGKTTLVHKVARDWAQGECVLQGARMVFLVILRQLSMCLKLEDLMEEFYPDSNLRAKVVEELLACDGKGACFIIDGLDEYEHEKKDSVIYKLIYQKYLHSSMKIVAARPVATNRLKKYCSPERIEVLGFNKSQISRYVREYPFEKCQSSMVGQDDLAAQLLSYLNLHGNILHMCYLPVHLSMICNLFGEKGDKISHTETKIYEQFIISTLLRFLMRDSEDENISSLESLRTEERSMLLKIGQLAFEMTANSQQVVTQNSLETLCGDIEFDVAGLGLLTVEHTCQTTGKEVLYSFAHSTFQEFLAAFFVSEMEDFDQRDLFLEYSSRAERLKNVWKFYCGLARFDDLTIPVLFGDRNQRQVWPSDPSYQVDACFDVFDMIQCAFESQQKQFCDFVVKNSTFTFSNKIFTASEFLALGYVLSASTLYKMVSLTFIACHWHEEAISCFSVKVENQRLIRVKLHDYIYLKEGSEEAVRVMNGILSKLPFIENLDIVGIKLNESLVQSLTKGLSLPNLQFLKTPLPVIPYSDPQFLMKALTFGSSKVKSAFLCPLYDTKHGLDFSLWKKCLHSAVVSNGTFPYGPPCVCSYNCELPLSEEINIFSCCSTISLVNCGVTDEGAGILAEGLNESQLTSITLDFNRISDIGIIVLSAYFATCTVLREVSVQCNSIGDAGAEALAGILQFIPTIKKLDLQGNAINNEGAVAIAKAAESLPKLELYLCGANITEEGVQTVLRHKEYAKVRALDFMSASWNGIEHAEIDIMKKALLCGTLPLLQISRSSVEKIRNLAIESGFLRNVRGVSCILEEGNEDILPDLDEIIGSLNEVQVLKLMRYGSSQEYPDSFATLPENVHCFKCNYLSTSWCLRSVQYLDLSNSKLCDASVQSVCGSGIFKDLCSLNLSSSLAGLDKNSRKEVLKALVYCNNLQSLNLSSNRITDDDMELLSCGLTHLKEFYLAYNHFSSSGLVSLEKCKNLLVLDILGNNIKLSSERCLSSVLNGSPIRHLDLSYNSIYCDGSATLMDRACSTLQVLRLSGTLDSKKLHKPGDMIVGVVKCRQLLELDISDNWILLQDLSDLSEGLQNFKNLCRLNLSYNRIKEDCTQPVLTIIKNCSSLHWLGLSGNHISVEGAVSIVSAPSNHYQMVIELRHCLKGHEYHLSHPDRSSCSSCSRFLEQYYSNDSVIVEIEMRSSMDHHYSSYLPKKFSLSH